MQQWNPPWGTLFQNGIAADPQAWHGEEARHGGTLHFDRQRAALEAWTIRTGGTRSTGRRREKNLKNF